MISVILEKKVVRDEHNAPIKNNYWGLVDDLFFDGTEYLLTARVDASMYFPTKKIIKLNIKLPSGKRVDLECELKWSLQTSYDKDLFILGMIVFPPPKEFKEFVTGVYDTNKSDVMFINLREDQ